MDLVLWRHADAGVAGEGTQDLLRPLSAKGHKQAARMSAWLQRQLPHTARVISSPAQRTIETAQHLGRPFKKRLELAPDAGVDDLLGLTQPPHDKGVTLIVGHQPILGATLAKLLAVQDGVESAAMSVSVKKGSLWWIRRKVTPDAVVWSVVTVQSPDML